MQLKKFRRTALIMCVVAVTAAPALCIFGFEDTVEPGLVWTLHLGQELVRLEQSVNAARSQVDLVRQNLELARQNLIRLGNKRTYLTRYQNYKSEFTQNRYGETMPWPQAMNGNPASVPSAYRNSTLALNPNLNLNNETLGQSVPLANLASVEQADSANVACLQSVAEFRANQQQNQRAVSSLDNVVADGTDATNSNVAQLNSISAVLVQQRNQQSAAAALQACLVQQQALSSMQQRNVQVDALNLYADVDHKRQANPMQLTGMGTTLRDAEIK